jgi:hypothetical protein
MASLAVTVPKIAQCLAMMRSAHDDEALNAAARAAERLRAQLGLQWTELLTNLPLEPPQRPEPSSREEVDPLRGRDLRAVAAACARHRALMNAWEISFINRLPAFPRLSPKQRDALVRTVNRLRACGFQV